MPGPVASATVPKRKEASGGAVFRLPPSEPSGLPVSPKGYPRPAATAASVRGSSLDGGGAPGASKDLSASRTKQIAFRPVRCLGHPGKAPWCRTLPTRRPEGLAIGMSRDGPKAACCEEQRFSRLPARRRPARRRRREDPRLKRRILPLPVRPAARHTWAQAPNDGMTA